MPATSRQFPESAVFCASAALTLVGILAFTGLQYFTPAAFHSIMGNDYSGFLFYTRHLGITPASCSVQGYVTSFRLILISLVFVHLIASRTVLSIDPKFTRAIFLTVVVVNLFVAVIYPPAQSVDTFNYTALARISAYYGLNPYTHSSLVLVERHDEVASFLKLAFRSMYGPLWTLFSAGLIMILRGAGLFAQILSYKVLEGVGLIVGANAALRYCGRRSPAFGMAALIAVGLNPLCLLEGPGNGHNDILMMCLALVALDLYDRKRWEASGLLTGLSAAIKFVPFFVLPWIGLDLLQQKALLMNRRTLVVVLLILLPTVLSFAPFWDHGAALAGLMQRSQGQREVLITKAHAPMPSGPQSPHGGHVLEILSSEKGVVGLYLMLTLLLLTRKRLCADPELRKIVHMIVGESGYPAWLVLWVVQATLQRYVVSSYWFSWYYTWAIFPAACIWTKKGNPLFVATMCMALVDTLFYTF